MPSVAILQMITFYMSVMSQMMDIFLWMKSNYPYSVECRMGVDGPYAKIEELELTIVSSPLYIDGEFLIVYDMSEFELTVYEEN